MENLVDNDNYLNYIEYEMRREAIIKQSINEKIEKDQALLTKEIEETLKKEHDRIKKEQNVGLTPEQLTLRKYAIDKLIEDLKQYLDDIIEGFDYEFIGIPEESIIKVNMLLCDISTHFKFLSGKYDHIKLDAKHCLINYEIVDFMEKYTKENNISFHKKIESNMYIFTITKQ